MASMNELIDGLRGLAALPQTVLRVTTMLTGGNASTAEIEHVARNDEALSLAILRRANSARFGRPGCTFTLHESIARLGTSALLKIVLEQKAAGMFADRGEAYGLQRGQLWRSAIGGAIAAERVAQRANFGNPGLAFVCALLRDVGKLAFDAHFGTRYMLLIEAHANSGRQFVEMERSAFGFDHARLGAELVMRWGLPQRIADAIAFHHDPPTSPPAQDVLFDIVHAADIISLWAGLAIGCDGMQYKLANHVRVGLKLDRPAAEHIISEVWNKLRESEVKMAPPARKGVAA